MARLFALEGSAKKAKSFVQAALENDTSADIQPIRQSEDLAKVLDKEYLKTLSRVSIKADVINRRMGKPDFSVEVKNTAPYVLTNVRMTLKLKIANQKDPEIKTLTAGRLLPNQSYLWHKAFQQGAPISLTIDSDQGKAEVKGPAMGFRN